MERKKRIRRNLQGSPTYILSQRRRLVVAKERSEAGLCVKCGIRPATASSHVPKPPFRHCDECRARSTAVNVGRYKERRDARRKAGLCPYCGKVRLAAEEKLCGACLEASRIANSKNRNKRKRAVPSKARKTKEVRG